MVFPVPCLCKTDRKGNDFTSLPGWAKKLAEEYTEAQNEILSSTPNKEKIAEELGDVITVCVSLLRWLGYGPDDRSELFRQINVKNFKRGYLNNE